MDIRIIALFAVVIVFQVFTNYLFLRDHDCRLIEPDVLLEGGDE